MVARLNTRKSIQKALNYNEAKVTDGIGELFLASGFGGQMSTTCDSRKSFTALNSSMTATIT